MPLQTKWILIANLGATLVMAGVIWAMQWVHYPLFSSVGHAEFPAYELAHVNRITTLVLPFMLLEAVTAFLLVLDPPAGVSAWILWAGLGLVVLIWLSTLMFQTAQHSVLAAGFDESAHTALVNYNWIRTLAWTLRGLLMLGGVMTVLK